MKKGTIFSIAAATVCAWVLGAFLSRKLNAPAVYATTHPVAFTAEMLTTSTDSNNTKLQHARSQFAQRSNGSSVFTQKSAGLDEPAGIRRILDVNSKKVISVDPNTKSISSFHYSDKELDLARNPSASCEHRTNLARVNEPQEIIFGVQVERYSGKLTGTSHQVSRWLAPELNCFVLKQEVAYSDTRYQYVQRQVTTSLWMGEPDPALFEVPSDYVERSPAEVLSIARQQRKVDATPMSEHTARSLDGVYRSRQSPK
jgi:hypothetical protein